MPGGPAPVVAYTSNQYGMGSFTGLNSQIGFWACNNSGQYLAHGDVVVFDTLTALDTHETDINGAATGTQASQTLTVDDTTGFATAGNLLVVETVLAGGPAVPVFATYTGVTGTTFTGTTMYVASTASGIADEAIVVVPPLTPQAVPVTTGQSAGLPSTGAAGTFVTLAGLSKSANVAGVVSVTGDATTATSGPLCGGQSPPSGWGVTAHPPVIPPLGDVFVVVSGVARVNIAGLTVAAAGLLATATIPGTADDTPATIGNLLGVALEAQSAKDANNCIRARICLG